MKSTAQTDRIQIEAISKASALDDMLSRFDPERHGGEAMALAPVGKEGVPIGALDT